MLRHPFTFAFMLAFAAAVVVACDDGVKADTGDDAQMQVANAQFYRGPIPQPNGGPDVISVNLQNTILRVGTTDKPLAATLDTTAKAAAIGLDGDTGYWLVQAGAATFETPGKPSLTASLAFQKSLSVGAHSLVVAAVDAAGHFGAPNATAVTAVNLDQPKGRLIISLTWDTESDLDLHVVDPNGIEIYKGDINSYEKPPPGSPPDASAYLDGGILDFDSNANCVIDGRREENVTWQNAPPSGHYLVRVDTFSLCATDHAYWTVTATLDGNLLAKSQGESLPSDVQMPHDRGAGVLALELDVP
jgi:hypothetical protein